MDVEIANRPSRAEWADRIAVAWRGSVEGILETGRLLVEAKAALQHGEWGELVENELPFRRETAFKLMKVTADPRLSDVAHVQHLPPSWGHLYELTKLDDGTFGRLIADGTIRPDMKRTAIGAALRQQRKAADEIRVRAIEPIQGKHNALVVDPPWDYEGLSLAGRATPGYATMSHDELLALDVEQWASDDCHLYLWTTNNFLTRAVSLMDAWGFQHKTVLTWVKPRWGLGSYFRNSTEHVLFGVRGEMRTRADDIPTHFEAPMGEHSEKPEAFYNIVRRASHAPYGEAFQRTARPDFANLFYAVEAA